MVVTKTLLTSKEEDTPTGGGHVPSRITSNILRSSSFRASTSAACPSVGDNSKSIPDICSMHGADCCAICIDADSPRNLSGSAPVSGGGDLEEEETFFFDDEVEYVLNRL